MPHSAPLFELAHVRLEVHVEECGAESSVVALIVAVVHAGCDQHVCTTAAEQLNLFCSHIVKVVGLEVILKAAVTGPGGEQQMHTIPQEMEGGGNEGEVGQDAGVVAERGLHERGD